MIKPNEIDYQKKVDRTKLVENIRQESKDNLMIELREKTNELTKYIVDLLNEKGKYNVNDIQILSLIARRSTSELASLNNVTYTPQEILIGFNLYLEMIEKINEVKKFPPTVESFALFMGISSRTYNNWLVDPYKKEVMDFIHSFLLGSLATSSLTGELKEISSMFLQKTMGKVEQTTPIMVKHEVTANVEDIQKRLSELKRKKVLDAEWEVKDEGSRSNNWYKITTYKR